MSTEGQKYSAELIRLEGKRKELEDALGRLARDEAEAQEVMDLAAHVQRLEQEVESARAAAQMEKKDEDMNDTKARPSRPHTSERSAATWASRCSAPASRRTPSRPAAPPRLTWLRLVLT